MEIILKPFSWLLLFFYNFFNNYGLALILFAFIIKLILFPVTLKGKKSMIQMNMLSGKLEQLKRQYGKDKERYNLEMQKLYEKEKVSPYGGCLWSFIPVVLLILLYAIIREPLVNLMGVPSNMVETIAEITGINSANAYSQIAMAEAMNDPAILAQVQVALGEAGASLFVMDFSFLGINLASIPTLKFWTNGLNWASIGLFILPLVSTFISFLSMKVSMATNKMGTQTQNAQVDRTNKTMMWTMPLMSLWIGFTVPAGLSVYWIAQYLVTMVQEVICGRLLKKDYEAARIAAEERERQEKEDEKRRKEEARLERARRAEEEKKNKGKKKSDQKKADDPEQEKVNRDDSREGIRAYARGRAYIPDRFGGVTEYVDPDVVARARAEAKAKAEAEAANKKKKKKTAPAEKTKEEAQVQLPDSAEQKAVVEETAAAEEQAAQSDAAPDVQTEADSAAETEEVEVEVEEIEVEVDEDENKEGV